MHRVIILCMHVAVRVLHSCAFIIKCKLPKSSAAATITLKNFARVIEIVGTFLILIKVVFSRILRVNLEIFVVKIFS